MPPDEPPGAGTALSVELPLRDDASAADPHKVYAAARPSSAGTPRR